MPAPWSKSAPKSDRRQQWKALKAKYATTISLKTVEVGLGKALDEHQKQVDAILKLDVTALKAETFAPVVASAKAMQTLAAGLAPKVKANADYTAFLAELKKDALWWAKTAQDFKQTKGDVSSHNQDQVGNALRGAQDMKDHGATLDALLKGADKKAKGYAPNEYVVKYILASAKLRPQLAKLTVLAKNPTGNFKLITELFSDADEAIKAVRLQALYVRGLNRTDLPAKVNFQQVVAAADAVANGADAIRHGVVRLRSK